MREWSDTLKAGVEAILDCYHQCPSIDVLVPVLLELPGDRNQIVSFLRATSSKMIVSGVPVKPMLGKIGTSIDDLFKQFAGLPFTCEIKYDGVRSQIHLLADGAIRIFSRHLEDNTKMWPDVVAMLTEQGDKAVFVHDATSDITVNMSAEPGSTGSQLSPACRQGVSDENVSYIIDAEIVAVKRKETEGDKEGEATFQILPFQTLSTRPRGGKGEDVSVGKQTETGAKQNAVQVMVFAFDVLFLGGKSLLKVSFGQRRQLLKSVFRPRPGYFQFADAMDVVAQAPIAPPPAVSKKDISDRSITALQQQPEDEELEATRVRIMDYLRASLQCGEGLMAKCLGPESFYEPNRRSEKWIKVKKDYIGGLALHDTLDLVPLGGWYGSGRKSQWLSPILLGVYDEETECYQSLCKCMSGFSDAFYKEMTARFQATQLDSIPAYYTIAPSMRPPFIFPLGEVWEMRGADLTISPVHQAALGIIHPENGLSLRFPRFVRIRPDKKPTEATSAAQLAAMYRMQSDAAKVSEAAS